MIISASTNITDTDQTEADKHIQQDLSLHILKISVSTWIYTSLPAAYSNLSIKAFESGFFSTSAVNGDSQATFRYLWQVAQSEKWGEKKKNKPNPCDCGPLS